MTTKLLIISLCMLSGTMAGLVFSKSLVKRAEYYAAFVKFINAVISEVRFLKNPISDVITEFMNSNPSPLNTHLNDYLLTTDKHALTLSKSVIKKREHEDVKAFLISIGATDAQTQLFELEHFKLKFTERSAEADEKRKKFSSMYIKLGFFAGLLLGILLI